MLKNYSIGRIGVNVNADPSVPDILERLRVIEEKGIKIVWIGEFEGFLDPFDFAEFVASNTSMYVGFGIVSPLRRKCSEIYSKFLELREKFGDRFLLGLGAGARGKEAFRVLKACVERIPCALVGCSSPMITRFASRNASGILFNSVNPSIISRLMGFMDGKVFTAAYGPALVLPSEFEEDLLIATAIIFKESYSDLFDLKLPDVDFGELVRLRQEGKSIREHDSSKELFAARDFLFRNFSISGSREEVVYAVKTLLKLCDHVVLADPFFRDFKSLEILDRLVVECGK